MPGTQKLVYRGMYSTSFSQIIHTSYSSYLSHQFFFTEFVESDALGVFYLALVLSRVHSTIQEDRYWSTWNEAELQYSNLILPQTSKNFCCTGFPGQRLVVQ